MANEGFNSRSLSNKTIQRLRAVSASQGIELSDPQVIELLLSFYENNAMNKDINERKPHEPAEITSK